MLRTLTLDDCLRVIRNMRPEDRACKVAALGWSVSDEVFAISRFQTEGPAWTLVQDDEPVAIFGLSIAQWTALAWLVATPAVTMQSWGKLIRHARTVRSNLGGSALHRVEAHVLSEWSAAQRFAEHLGFIHEGTRRAAGSGREDVQVFGLVPEEKR